MRLHAKRRAITRQKLQRLTRTCKNAQIPTKTLKDGYRRTEMLK